MTATSLIESKIQELCTAIMEDEEVLLARGRAEAFLADPEAVSVYREMATMGRSLHQKQHNGEEPTEAEVDQFTALQDRCDDHPLIPPFLEAQQFLSGIAERVSTYVGKTLEEGRVPTEAEMDGSGGCGEGCGCHH